MKGFCKFLLKLLGWKTYLGVTPEKKCIIIGAPHTSVFDFIISWLFWTSVGRRANVLIKKEMFFWPLGNILRNLGGIPVDRSKGANILRQSIHLFNEREEMDLAIAVEGTRRKTSNWKAGFHVIASAAKVPVYIGTYDWGKKQVSVSEEFKITADAKADLKRLKNIYREMGVVGRHPEKFTTE